MSAEIVNFSPRPKRDKEIAELKSRIRSQARIIDDLRFKLEEMVGARLQRPNKMRQSTFRLINLLAKRSPMVITGEGIIAATSRDPLALECDKGPTVAIHYARNELAKMGITDAIVTQYGDGYYMTREAAAAWKAHLASINGGDDGDR